MEEWVEGSAARVSEPSARVQLRQPTQKPSNQSTKLMDRVKICRLSQICCVLSGFPGFQRLPITIENEDAVSKTSNPYSLPAPA